MVVSKLCLVSCIKLFHENPFVGPKCIRRLMQTRVRLRCHVHTYLGVKFY
jgi:hypothetical protein